MGNNWTDEQRLAIEARGSNLLVSAAAGRERLRFWWKESYR